MVAFKTLINPALSKSYASAKASFVDVTAAASVQALTRRPSQPRTKDQDRRHPFPSPVARFLQATWFCAKGDIHATTKGYDLIGRLIVQQETPPQQRPPEP